MDREEDERGVQGGAYETNKIFKPGLEDRGCGTRLSSLPIIKYLARYTPLHGR